MGWFPCSKVQPFISRPTPDLSDFLWFAGNMDRSAAKNLLISRSDGTFLVRQKDGGEFAISLKFNMDIRHIKITSTEGLYRINEKKAFKGLIEMVQFYQQHSLKEYFKDVDTTLQTPFNQPEQSGTPFNTPSPGTQTHTTLQTPFNQPEQSGTPFNTPCPGTQTHTTLQTPFNQPEQSGTPFNTPSPGTQTHTTLQTPFNQPEQSGTPFNTPCPGTQTHTTLQTPFNQPEQSGTPFNTPSPGTQTHTTLQTPFNQPEQSGTPFNTPSPARGSTIEDFHHFNVVNWLGLPTSLADPYW
ncbi:putative uncharacterized protein DDB_G0290521 [Oncorhynchus keta]|uniref:putative uncharacterized protein DDB_G0290521 n=1 Tax=Oncorhynchus keta TaxID=8018 RepID=UPI00227A9F8B|nr:putative uncharacterized protein DDB_G0290521 [Oncorhynchus keta]